MGRTFTETISDSDWSSPLNNLFKHRHLLSFFLFILLSGCTGVLHSLFPELKDNTVFQGKMTNRFFDYRDLKSRKVVLLPIRASMGGGGDDRLNAILIQTIKEKLPGIYLITDEQADRYFTEKDMWDDYFSYVSIYDAKGLVEIDELSNLYSHLQATVIFAITSDFRFWGMEGMYPRNFTTFVSMQIFDLIKREILWDGLAEAQDVIESEEDKDMIAKNVFTKVTKRLLTEITR